MGSSLQIYIALSALSFKFVPACQDGKLSVLFIYLLSSFICCCALLVDVFFFFFFFLPLTRACVATMILRFNIVSFLEYLVFLRAVICRELLQCE